MADSKFSFKLKLSSLGAKAIVFVHKGGRILAECRMQVVRGEEDAPAETPSSPKFIFYADRSFIKDLDAGAVFELTFKQLVAPTRPVTDTEEKRAKAVYKEIKNMEALQDKAAKELAVIKKKLATAESKAKGAGGINSLPLMEQQELRALRSQAGYVMQEVDRHKGLRKDLEFRLPDAYQGKDEKEAAAIAKEAEGKAARKKAAVERTKRPSKAALS